MRSDVRREDFRAPRGAPEDLDLALGLVGLGRPAPTGPTLAVTPVTASPYEAAPHLLGLPRPVLLDSSLANSQSGRYSYLTADPFLIVRSRGRRVELVGPAGRTVVEADPFDLLRSLASRYPLPRQAGLPPLVGGAVGYFGYDLGRLLESLPATNPTDGELPELDLGFYDWVLAADHSSGEGWLIATGLPAGTQTAARARLEEIQARLEAPVEPPKGSLGSEGMDKASGEIPPRFLSNVRRGDYLAAVHRAKEYIAAGDVYQVNLSHRLEAKVEHPSDGRAWLLYERLRTVSPVPHGAYLDLGDVVVLSASPERFLHLDTESVETRPIKGTRPRGRTPHEDEAMRAGLICSEKDRAENLMIVDLLRNDLGKVCRVGSVRVPELFGLEGYSSVWHLVSTVTGELQPDLSAVDLLRACFPGGSVTGCPKIRAMEIIEELEPIRRGVYCGAIGYLSFTGAMDTSIAIRTLVLSGDRMRLQVGGAVVADSDPKSEYAETLAKGRAVLNALGAELEE
jgi:para-aminobenzoate synthetase component I